MSSFGNCPDDCPTGREHFDLACADREYPELQQLTPGLARFFNEGIQPGGFLTAVLNNNLQEALTRADPESIATLQQLVLLLYNHAPAIAWGSAEVAAAWRERVRAKVTA